MNISSEWLKRIPGKDIEGALSLLNSLGWNISERVTSDQIKLFAGDRWLISSSNKQEVESFIFGMALSLAVLPEEILNQIRKIIRD